MIFRAALSMIALAVLAPFSMAADQPPATTTSLFSANASFQYREPIGADGDQSKARAKILADAEQDCETLGKAFGKRCMINNINFNASPLVMQLQQQSVVVSQGQNQPNAWYLSATVNVQLQVDPTKPQ